MTWRSQKLSTVLIECLRDVTLCQLDNCNLTRVISLYKYEYNESYITIKKLIFSKIINQNYKSYINKKKNTC